VVAEIFAITKLKTLVLTLSYGIQRLTLYKMPLGRSALTSNANQKKYSDIFALLAFNNNIWLLPLAHSSFRSYFSHITCHGATEVIHGICALNLS